MQLLLLMINNREGYKGRIIWNSELSLFSSIHSGIPHRTYQKKSGQFDLRYKRNKDVMWHEAHISSRTEKSSTGCLRREWVELRVDTAPSKFNLVFIGHHKELVTSVGQYRRSSSKKTRKVAGSVSWMRTSFCIAPLNKAAKTGLRIQRRQRWAEKGCSATKSTTSVSNLLMEEAQICSFLEESTR